jgi:hypothetical protein
MERGPPVIGKGLFTCHFHLEGRPPWRPQVKTWSKGKTMMIATHNYFRLVLIDESGLINRVSSVTSLKKKRGKEP